jgi:hypothetical protein
MVFPSLGILQHYVEFDTHTIIMLEKLLGVGSFGGSIGHLIHCQATLPIFSNELSFLFMVHTTAPTFLGCWALIILALVICF